MFGNENDPVAYGGGAGIGQALQTKRMQPPTVKERMEQAVLDAEERLTEAKRALELLKANPDLEELLNIMQKGRY